ncbi:MAG: diguanylate cyclase [Thermoanaerobaculia bacterium]|nr:diguanylate cyclase [Thermoanaerobaculia bacterium]
MTEAESRDLTPGEYLREIQMEFLGEMQQRIDDLEQIWLSLKSGWRLPALEDLHRLAHSLHGEGATFGFDAVAGAAHALESVLKPLRDEGDVPEEQIADSVERQISALRRASLRYSADRLPPLPGRFDGIPKPPQEAAGRVVLVDDDRDLASAIGLQLRHYGYTVEVFVDPDSAEQSIRERPPAAVLMDVVFEGDHLAGTELVRRLHDSVEDPPPILFLSSRSDLEARLHAIRAGGKGYLTKPVDLANLAERLDRITGRKTERPYEVLIVDDDEKQARYTARILQEADVHTTVLTDPLRLLDSVSEIRPDLLLLDLYMPDCSGPELAEVLRQHEMWLPIPIVFLSSETNPDEQIQALSRGGDEFLTKPVDPETLVATVLPRARRGRQLGSLIELDGLTGLINHSQHQQRLHQEVRRAGRESSSLAFAMIDLDDFKSVNDTWGHAVGDRVLRSLAGMLKKRLRSTDIVARYGGDEFAVLMPSTEGRPAAGLMEELCLAFGQLSHSIGDNQFHVSLSCGVASFPEYADSESLAAAADRALYEVKEAGKSGVRLADADIV